MLCGVLIAIGGHEDKTPGPHNDNDSDSTTNVILCRFIGEIRLDGSVLVAPIASEHPEEAAADYLAAFGKLGVARVDVPDVRERQQVWG